MHSNSVYLNVLRTWTKAGHRAAAAVDFGDYVHDAKETWDLFYQLEAGGKQIDGFLPLTSSFGKDTAEGRLAHFFTLSLNELKASYPGARTNAIAKYKKGDLLPSGQTAKHAIFVRTLPNSLVHEFRAIVAKNLGL
jgi:hypothetical protein